MKDLLNESREPQPPPFLFAMAAGNPLLLGFVGAQSPAAAAPLHVNLLRCAE